MLQLVLLVDHLTICRIVYPCYKFCICSGNSLRSLERMPKQSKWFKPAVGMWAANAYWDSKKVCIKNTSNQMLEQVYMEVDGLVILAVWHPSTVLKTKQNFVYEASLNDTTLTVSSWQSTKRQNKEKPVKINQKDKLWWATTRHGSSQHWLWDCTK